MTSAPQPDRTAPRFSAEDLRIATEVLMRPLEEPVVELVSLTDEELVALDGIQHEPLTPVPWLDANTTDEAGRSLATAAAMRSMMARGIVTSSAVLDPRRYEDGSQEPARLVAVPELQAVAVLRRTADRVLIAERRTERGTSFSFFYVLRLDGTVRVLWEAFDDAGFHLFFLLEGETLPAQLIAFADPVDGIGDTDGEVAEVPAETFGESPEAARLAAARAVTSILVLDRAAEDPSGFTLFSTPDAVVLMESDPSGEHPVQRVGDLSRGTLTVLITDLAGLAPDGAGAQAGPEGDAAP